MVRTYQEGDEIQLVTLFNEAYQAYLGFVPRTVEYWRWSCLARPDVDEEGIVIVVQREKIVAYAVVGRSGNIWELCFDGAQKSEALVSLVLGKAVEYLRRVGSDAASLNLPCDDSVARDACKRAGFSELPASNLFLSVLDYEGLLRLLSSVDKEKLMSFGQDFLIRLRDARSWTSPVIFIGLRNGRLEIRSEDKPCDVLIETDTSTLASILFGTCEPLWALLRFELRIRPLRKVRRALKFLSLLTVNGPWFLPRADLG